MENRMKNEIMEIAFVQLPHILYIFTFKVEIVNA